MEEDNESTENNAKTARVERLQPFQFRKGQSGNPGGRPAGKSLKMYTREMLAAMTDDERQDFLHGIPKIEIFKMGEGNPDTKTDITTKGEKINITPDVLKVAIEYEKKLNEMEDAK